MNEYLQADISTGAIRHNIDLIRNLLAEDVRLCPVVKANAYGHGIEQVLGVLGDAADMLAVATGAEAMELRGLGWQGPVMVFITAAALDTGSLAELITTGATLTISSIDEITLLTEAVRNAHRPAEVFIKLDTGLTRNGVTPDKAASLVSAARESESIRLAGLYTHFARPDASDKPFTIGQFDNFIKAVDECGGRSGLVLHAANSAATIDLPRTHLDMVRTGISLYGCQPTEDLDNILPLKPALRLTSRIVLVKDVPAGSATGYGSTYTFPRAARVALVPVGYADGYPRSLSNIASMGVREIDCPVRGRISMDQTIIEITDVPKAAVGDEVEIISADPAASNSVANLARLAGTIPYEILARLGRRIKRVVVD
ncbi:MAG: alanine racemase [Planctomycetota bacterium]|nr:alanine racemase [Planctomycetota bacterium]